MNLPMAVRCVLFGAAVALLFQPMELWAQTGRITGQVTDRDTGMPLAGVHVSVYGTGLGATTRENGRYFIVNVPPGEHTLVAQAFGYVTVRRENVLTGVDMVRTEDFQVEPHVIGIGEVRVEVARVPLIETTTAGSLSTLTAADFDLLPVTNVEGALSLRQGFLQVPPSTEMVAFTETRRNPISPLRIRGGRQGETLVLLDGMPVNNFIFGGPAITLNRQIVRQVDYVRGGLEAQYGNAASGIVNVVTQEGGPQYSGGLEVQSSALGAALGQRQDELKGFGQYEGSLSGPVPGTDRRLRFLLAGRERHSADRVLRFDDDVFRISESYNMEQNAPHELDLFPGWRADGFDVERDVFGKLTYYFSPVAKLGLAGLAYRRQHLPFDFDYILTGFDPSQRCVELGEDPDACAAFYGRAGTRPTGLGLFQFITRSSVRLDRRLFTGRWDHTLGRSRYTIAAGVFDQSRLSCNYLNGVCLGDRFADTNYQQRFVAPGITPGHPAAGTDEFYGGESLRTLVGRADVEAQVTDHHNLMAGVFYQRHHLEYDEARNRGVNDVVTVHERYGAAPWDAAVYLQDRIEFDFVSIKLGARFDYGRAGGLFFADPLDPTNGTTARDVCRRPQDFQSVVVRWWDDDDGLVREEELSASLDWTWDLCTEDPKVLEQANLIATHDDFQEASRRRQFSPRVAIAFPVTETSNFFVNYGRYSQNPLLNNIYQGTGIGTAQEGVPGGPGIFSTAYTVGWIGNPQLMIERTDAYEIGYQAAYRHDFAVQVSVFGKDQAGLTGLAEASAVDPGAAYGTNIPRYWVLVNRDFQTVRGIELGLRRRLVNHWGFDVNYTYSEATTNAAAPEREAQGQIEEGDTQARREFPSEIDQPHVFNGSLSFAVGDELKDSFLGSTLRNSMLSIVVQAASGYPYTPTLGFSGVGESNKLDRNSGRGPASFRVDLLARKNWQVANLRYGAFVRIENLTDRINCIQVYASTGHCYGGTVDQDRERHGNPVGSGASSTFLDRPGYAAPRRSINAGFTIDF